ncbi:MAG TPA: polymer-forming cytoskeletal protein [Rubricoccaceae bacterium]|nr:polymer-forming cytoskeletal protein [Rubricoccaceae bacterium]
MALFNTGSPDGGVPNPRTAVNPAEQHNIIGKETTIEGTIRSAGNVHVSGKVIGNVEVEGRTVVMPGGLVEGEVVSTQAEIGGHVKGQLAVAERLVLKATAVIEGDLRTAKLIIEEGAVFTGRCDMGASAPRGRGAAPEAGERPTRRLGAEGAPPASPASA